MKALIYHKKHADKLILQEIPRPEPKEKEVLIKLVAASPNAADYRSMKLGLIPKHKVFGSAVSGVVEAVGQDVRSFKTGDAVIAELADFGFGGFAEYVVAPEKAMVLKPAELSFAHAATLPVAATTALKAIYKGKIEKGHQVLILGSAGGVGSFSLQLAKHFGAEVTAVCSSANLTQSLSLGADHVVDYTSSDILRSNQRFDLILAVNGNYPLLACKRLLKKNGIYVMVGGSMPQIFKALLLGWLFSFGSRKIKSLSFKPDPKDLELLARLMADGKLKPVIENEYPFEQAAQAINYLAQGHAKGKVIIRM